MFKLALSAGLAAAASAAFEVPADLRAEVQALLDKDPFYTIPDGVTCTEATVCDHWGYCSIVCERGSVEISPWLKTAVATQNALAEADEMTYAFLPGTHNTGITLADGYGNEDQVWNTLMKLLDDVLPWAAVVTNDQYLSFTDQLNMGVRFIELDTHFFLGDLRIAHCGGLSIEKIDDFIEQLNKVAEKLGLEIRWDTETVGCDPSLSAIPAGEQRTLPDALAELADWFAANPGEFVQFFFDDEMDLAQWGETDLLLQYINDAFDNSTIYTPADKDAYSPDGCEWPTVGEMKAAGKQMLFMSGADLGGDMSDLIFAKYGERLCGWEEPHANTIYAFPNCTATSMDSTTMQGHPVRPEASELQYGPLNSSGGWGPNTDNLNTTTLAAQTACGANSPSPDLITPERMAAMVWTWAEDEPKEGAGPCTVLSAATGRWQADDCSAERVAVCAVADGRYELANWGLSAAPLAGSEAPVCPDGMAFVPPTNGWQQQAVLSAMSAQGVESAYVSWVAQ